MHAGAGGDVTVAENDVLAIGRDAVRQVGGRHICDEAAENFNRSVE